MRHGLAGAADATSRVITLKPARAQSFTLDDEAVVCGADDGVGYRLLQQLARDVFRGDVEVV